MMRRLATVAMATFAMLHLVAIVGPAVVLAAAARKGGLPGAHGIDLVAASGLLGLAHGATVWHRLQREFSRDAFRDTCIAALDALVVLALLSTGLLFALLGGLAPEHAAIVNRGWPIIAVWVAVQVVAVGLAELVRTGILRWLGGASSARPPQDERRPRWSELSVDTPATAED